MKSSCLKGLILGHGESPVLLEMIRPVSDVPTLYQSTCLIILLLESLYDSKYPLFPLPSSYDLDWVQTIITLTIIID